MCYTHVKELAWKVCVCSRNILFISLFDGGGGRGSVVVEVVGVGLAVSGVKSTRHFSCEFRAFRVSSMNKSDNKLWKVGTCQATSTSTR